MKTDHQSEMTQSWHPHRRGVATNGVIGSLVIGAIFGTVGFCLIWFWGWPVLQHAKASEQWSDTNGVVASSQVIYDKDSDGDTTYKPDILYNYQVNGKSYQQGNIRYDGSWASSRSTYARDMVRKYPVGKQVDVYYDPDEVSEAVLEPGVIWASYFPLGFGLIFFLVGAGIFLGVGGPLLLKMFIARRAASGMIGDSGTQNGNQDKNRYSKDWGKNDQDSFSSR